MEELLINTQHISNKSTEKWTLSRSNIADDCNEFTFLDSEVDAFEGDELIKSLDLLFIFFLLFGFVFLFIFFIVTFFFVLIHLNIFICFSTSTPMENTIINLDCNIGVFAW